MVSYPVILKTVYANLLIYTFLNSIEYREPDKHQQFKYK